MKHMIYTAMAISIVFITHVSYADSYAYLEHWTTGVLTTGEPFESWRIHIVVPDGDDWMTSGIDGWTFGGSTWYYNWEAGPIPDPEFFETYPNMEFSTYWTSPHLYPNSELLLGLGVTADGVVESNFLHLGGWFDDSFDTNSDYVVWQGTALNPITAQYGTIAFVYVTMLENYPHYSTFAIPEPATVLLLALVAGWTLRGRSHAPRGNT